MTTRIKKGQHATLNVTKEAQQRIFVGLSWDPNTRTGLCARIMGLLNGKKSCHDLDLSCAVYNGRRDLITTISAKDGQSVDPSGKIYHSGDNLEGIGADDDEQISVELKDLPDEFHHLTFKIAIKSGQTFDEINAPEIHITDGYSGHNFLRLSLHDDPKHAQASNYIFIDIYREEYKDWRIHHIGEFV